MAVSKSNIFTFRILLSAFVLAGVVAPVAPKLLGLLPAATSAVLIAHALISEKQLAPFNKTFLKLTGTICILLLISLLWTIDFTNSAGRTIKVCLLLLSGPFILGAFDSVPEIKRKRIIYLHTLSLIAGCALWIIYESISNGIGSGFVSHVFKTTPPTFSSSNQGATICVVLMWAAFFYFKNHAPGALLILMIMISALALTTESAASQLGLIIGLATALCAIKKPPLTRAVIFSLTALSILFGPLIARHAEPHLSNFSIAEPVRQLATSAHVPERLHTWREISKKISEKPMLGYGIESTKLIKDFAYFETHRSRKHREKLGREKPETMQIWHPHSLILQVWIELGVIGVLVCLWLLLKTCRTLSARPHQGQLTFICLFAALVTISFTSHGMWQSWWLGLIIIAVCAAHESSRQTQRNAMSSPVVAKS